MSKFSDLLKVIVLTSPSTSPKHTSNLLPVDYTNNAKLDEELTEIASLSGNDIIKHDGKFYKASKYRDALNITLEKIDAILEKKAV